MFQKNGNPSINYIETCSTSVNTLWERKLIWQTFKRKKNGLHTLANIQNYRRHKNPYFKIPILQNAACNTFCYTDEEKAESFAEYFEKIHNTARNTFSPYFDNKIKSIATNSLYNNSVHVQHLICTPLQIKNLIKNLPKNKVPKPDKISTTAFEILSTSLSFRVYYTLHQTLLFSCGVENR